MKLLFLPYLLLLLPGCLDREYPIEFFKEEVRMEITSSTVMVNGHYFFRNRTLEKKLVKLYYPFPVDEYHLYPDSVDVKGMNFKRVGDGLVFLLEMGPRESTDVKVAYRQALLTNHARYILTSAREWGEPIAAALFIVTAPRGYELTLSYRPDSVAEVEEKTICYFVRNDLFPEKELDVWWEKP